MEQEFDDPDKQVREIMSSQLTVEKDITLIDRDEGIAMESFLQDTCGCKLGQGNHPC